MKRNTMRFWALITALVLFTGSALAYDKLQKGDHNNQVAAMQQALRSLGYSITVDGKYGTGTVAVIKSFQRNHGLKVDGVAGDQTLTLLYSLTGSGTPIPGGNPTPIPTPVPASGGWAATVVTTGGSLNLRASARGGANIITTIPNSARVTVTSRGGTWCSVQYNGYAGFVMTQFLSFGGTAPTAAPTAIPTAAPTQPGGVRCYATVTTTGGSLNLRESARANARIIMTIPFGASLPIYSRGDVWCQTSYAGAIGYVMTQFLSFGSAPTAASTQTPALPTTTPSQAVTAYAYVQTTGGSLNLRQAARSGAKVLTTIPFGAQVAVTSRGSTWCGVIYNGISGYAMTSFLRFEQSAATPTPIPTVAPQPTGQAPSGTIAYVQTTGGSLNLRREARSGANIITTIPNGTALQVITRNVAWCQVLYNGQTGYVMTDFLRFSGATETPAPTAAPTPTQGSGSVYAIVTTSGGSLNLRAEKSGNAKVLTTIPNAASVLVYQRGSDWCAVAYAGTSGYVMTRYLTFLGAAPTPGVTPTPAADDDPSVYKRTLRSGMVGEDVSWVQSRLIALGYSAVQTGVYDAKTIAAVKAFQGQNALSADGVAGSQTFAMLRSSNARRADDAPLNYTTLRVDDKGEAVTSMQKALKTLGYTVAVNGEFDVATHNAVVAFQQRNSLVISGIADALTRQLIHSESANPASTPVQELPADEGKIAGPARDEIKLLHWFDQIKPTISAGQKVLIYDPNTSISWQLKLYSLGRHADSEPVSWRDTQLMNRSFGSSSWTIHPVYVQLPNGKWTMATMHNRPHLYGSITDNGFGGHLCVHFLRDMDECSKNDPNYGVNNQKTLRSAWKALTGEAVD